jgi:hypothetical protein
MTLFYKGVAAGTFHHSHDLRLIGLAPRHPGGAPGLSSIISHIRRGPAVGVSPYISLTRSYGIAADYAHSARFHPSLALGHVYVIEITDPPPAGVVLLDPVGEIALAHRNPATQHSYHHDGDKNFLLGIVDGVTMRHHLTSYVKEPPGSGATVRFPRLSDALEAMVRGLRDAEVIVLGNLPASCFIQRFDV